MNGLTDPEVIDALYRGLAGRGPDRAHRAGAVLPASRRARPVGQHHGAVDRRAFPRALAHLPLRRPRRASARSRYIIGSADLMERNLDRRIEVLVPVIDPELRSRLDETLELNLADDISPGSSARTASGTACPSTA